MPRTLPVCPLCQKLDVIRGDCYEKCGLFVWSGRDVALQLAARMGDLGASSPVYPLLRALPLIRLVEVHCKNSFILSITLRITLKIMSGQISGRSRLVLCARLTMSDVNTLGHF